MAVKIQFRRGTEAAWTAANPVLADGELAIETDTRLFKIGDGVTVWNSLDYGGISGEDGTPGTTGGANIDGGSPFDVMGGTVTVDGGVA